MALGTFEIARRFCGPPTSGNGGYVGGRLSTFVATDAAAPAVAVRLLAPPALERALEVRDDDGGAALYDGERKVATARAVPLELDPPGPPSFGRAEEARRAFRGFDEHVLPGCFVCGVERTEGDGLCIYPGPADDAGLFAAPWIPDASLGGVPGDALDAAFVWAALDCPGAFSFPQAEGLCLLGEMAARVFSEVRIGERCIVTSWLISRKGRKNVTGTALYGPDGDCRAYARATWIEVDRESVPRD